MCQSQVTGKSFERHALMLDFSNFTAESQQPCRFLNHTVDKALFKLIDISINKIFYVNRNLKDVRRLLLLHSFTFKDRILNKTLLNKTLI